MTTDELNKYLDEKLEIGAISFETDAQVRHDIRMRDADLAQLQEDIERLTKERGQARRNCLREVELLANEQEAHSKTAEERDALKRLLDSSHLSVILRGGINVWGIEFVQGLEQQLDALTWFDRVGKSIAYDYICIHLNTKMACVGGQPAETKE